LLIAMSPVIPILDCVPSAFFVFLPPVALSSLAGLLGDMKLLVITLFVAPLLFVATMRISPPLLFGLSLSFVFLMSASLAPWPVTLLLLFVPSALVALFAFVAPAPLVAFLVSGATLPVALLPVVAFLVSGGTLPVTLPLVKALLVFALSTLFASLAPVALS